jgi:hypothetical protein
MAELGVKNRLMPMKHGSYLPFIYSSRMAGPIIILVVLCAGIGLLLWWGTRLPPTRPRPTSRHRGETLMDVHHRLKRRR